MTKFNHLNWLLKPELDDNQFFNNIYEKQYLFIQRSNPNYYDEKLQDVRLQKLLEVASSLSILIKVVKEGQVAPVRFPLPTNELLEYLKNGYTFVLYNMEKYNPSIQIICKELSSQFLCPVKANMYVTPPKSQGLSPHYDDHDVIILQLFGMKRWEIFSKEVEKPVIFQLVGGLQPKTEPTILEITAGDLFYLPRGYVHRAAATSEDFSIHLTLGINVNTWYTYLDDMLKQITRDEVILRDAIHEISAGCDNLEKIKQITQLVCEKLKDENLQNKILEGYLTTT